jgi:murein DD-endopeptidase MepM/ murein hydrolase activator NlpD
VRKYFTIQIFSSDGLTAITRRISKPMLNFLIVVFILFILGVLALIVFYGRVYVEAMRVRNLEQRNQYLEGEFRKIKKLEEDIAAISKQREKLEIVLGLKERDETNKVEIKELEDEEKKFSLKEDIGGIENPDMKEYLEESKNKSRGIPNISPVNGWITQGFSLFHRGCDIAAPLGTPVISTMEGRVSYTGVDSILGNVVKIRSVSGYGTLYGHCSRIFVEKEDFVRKGQMIGCVGKTGRADVPHLHYEIEMNGVEVNPELFILDGNTK